MNSNLREDPGTVEWKRKEANGSSTIVPSESGTIMNGAFFKAWSFLKKAWELGVDDPRKVIHCLKVGVALTIVSLFYYMRPLYEGLGGTSMWAIMTVVVIFEYTVGATVCKCLNRATGTLLAGFLAVGVHWIASQSGENFEPVVVGVSVFLLASAATFSRFIPVIKARFDYGAMIFILTFSLVSVSGYRVEKLFYLARQRLSTIIIGISICVVITTLICPIWAGEELHRLIIHNMDKLANSLDCCAVQYFDSSGGTNSSDKEFEKKLQGYKCVMNSKATEETMAGFAIWEPAHGRFSFQHPWNQYVKIGASMRDCAYGIEALSSCLISENQGPDLIKKHLSDLSLRVSSNSSIVIRELATNIKTMRKSVKLDFLIEEMNVSVKELQDKLKSLPGLLIPPPGPEVEQSENDNSKSELISTAIPIPLVEVIPVATFASLLIEIEARVEGIVDAVEELETLAEFKPANDDKTKQNQPRNINLSNRLKDEGTMGVIQMV
ncbi:aluminum-activated malate transporter 10-like [Rhododendron vialii]|uniref:aluminum-activated malate transporter 10-like n=1 Tax=Rhododendron vialii TaxID=182163 RepID=UPI00265D7081|nr:aluminum-activated malate transporter 10-like [Rhododendron vialii]